jgi:sigma-B regulation protein RsbU (phosphoserine phosphatase)
VNDCLRERNIADLILEDILLSCDEAATNIVIHGYKDLMLDNPSISCAISLDGSKITVRLQDNGKEFIRKEVKPPSVEANLTGERRGGFGVFLMERLMDKVVYKREENTNVWLLEKKLK